MNQNKFTLYDHIGVGVLLYLILSAVFPIITLYGHNTILCLMFEMLWFALASYERHSKFMGLFRKWIWWFVFLLYLFVVPVMFDNNIVTKRYTPYYIGIFGVIMYEYYTVNDKMHVIGRAIKISMPFYLFTLFKTIYAAMLNPWVVRAMTTSSEFTKRETILSGVGNYEFVYSGVMFFSVAAIYFFFSNRFYKRLIAGIMMMSIFVLSIVTNYTTAMLSCVVVAIVSLTCYIVHCFRTDEGVRILELFAFMTILFIAILFKDTILSVFSGFIQEGSRIGYIRDSGNSSFYHAIYEEFIADRWPTMKQNLDLLMEHFFFGHVSLGVGITGELGQHSSILDTFSLWGIGVGIIFLKMLGLPYKRYDIYKDNLLYRKQIYAALIMIAFFNNLTHGILLASTVICPYFIYRLKDDNSNSHIIKNQK